MAPNPVVRGPRDDSARVDVGHDVGVEHRYRTTVAEVVSAPDELVLFCGVSIGYEDETAEPVHTDRAPLAETVALLD